MDPVHIGHMSCHMNLGGFLLETHVFRCGAFLLFFEASACESFVKSLDLVALATVGPQSSSNQCTTLVSNESKARSCRSCVCVLTAAGLSG